MSLVALDNTHMVQSLINDTSQLRDFIRWAKGRYQAYNQNVTTASMTAAGIAPADQPYVTSFIGDLNRIIQLSGGTVPSSADDMLYNITQLLGLS